MNDYGNMAGSVRRVAEYQKVEVQTAPGYGDDYYRVTVQENDKRVSDVFYVKTDAQLNAALNILLNRAICS